jgi:acetylornithine deacetylase
MADVVSLLARIIRVPTPNPGGDERALAALLEEELRVRGPDTVTTVEVPRDEGVGAYVLAHWGTPRLLVNAHLDTVPPNTGWSGDPYTPRVGDGRVMGLGAADTKGAIAAVLAALDEARPRDVAVLFSGDEERAGTCMRAFLASDAARGIAQAIVCEPTGCAAGTRHRGILGLKVRAAGEGGHSSRADRLPAPIAELARLAVAYDDWGRARRGSGPAGFEGMCMNVAKLEGGVAFNVVPDAATLTLSVRPPPGADAAAVREDLVALAHARVPGASVTTILDNAPFSTRDLRAFERWLGEAARAPRDLGFWTEAALLSEAGIDAVVYGPGDIAQAHAPDEWVAIADLEAARDAFIRAFRESARGSG